MFFFIFPLLEINENNNNNNNHNENFFFGHNRFWGTAQLCSEKKIFYCNTVFVLQRERELRAVCIAIQYFVL